MLLALTLIMCGCGSDADRSLSRRVSLLLTFDANSEVRTECLRVLGAGGVPTMEYEEAGAVLILVAPSDVPIGRDLLAQGGDVTRDALATHDRIQSAYPWNEPSYVLVLLLRLDAGDERMVAARDALQEAGVPASVSVNLGRADLVTAPEFVDEALRVLKGVTAVKDLLAKPQ